MMMMLVVIMAQTKWSKIDFSGGNMSTDIIKKLEEKRQKYLQHKDEYMKEASLLEQRELNASLYLKYKRLQRANFWVSVLVYFAAVVGALIVFWILQVYVN
jgi:hypothetical protein